MSEQEEFRTRNIQNVLGYLGDFFDHRFEYARKANPDLAQVKDDLIWFEFQSLEIVFRREKNVGLSEEGIHLPNIDYFTNPRYQAEMEVLLNIGQKETLFREVVTKLEMEEVPGKKEGQSNAETISSTLALYNYLTSVSKFIILFEHWLWWDLRYALDLNKVDLQKQLLASFSTGALDIQKFIPGYKGVIRGKENEEIEITPTLIMEFETKRTRNILSKLAERARLEEIHKRIPAHEEGEEVYNYKEHVIGEQQVHFEEFVKGLGAASTGAAAG